MAKEDLPPVHRYIGRIIHVMRKERGMRQSELATLTGLKQPNLSRIENGLVVPRPSTLQKVATALDMQVKELLSEEKAREVEAKWRATLSPRNAGLLFAGQLTAVPLFSDTFGYSAAFDAEGQPAGKVEVTLHLTPLKGHVFGMRVWDDSMESGVAGQDSFRRGEILVFSDQPPVQSGDFALVHSRDNSSFKKVEFTEGGESIRLLSLNPKYPEQEAPKAEVLRMWRLARRIQDF